MLGSHLASRVKCPKNALSSSKCGIGPQTIMLTVAKYQMRPHRSAVVTCDDDHRFSGTTYQVNGLLTKAGRRFAESFGLVPGNARDSRSKGPAPID